MTKLKRADAAEAVSIILLEGRADLTLREAQQAHGDMVSVGKRLHQVYERQCNGRQTPAGNWDEAAALRDERLEASLESKLRALFERCGLTLELNTDPRGAPVGIVTTKTKRTNSFAGTWRV